MSGDASRVGRICQTHHSGLLTGCNRLAVLKSNGKLFLGVRLFGLVLGLLLYVVNKGGSSEDQNLLAPVFSCMALWRM